MKHLLHIAPAFGIATMVLVGCPTTNQLDAGTDVARPDSATDIDGGDPIRRDTGTEIDTSALREEAGMPDAHDAWSAPDAPDAWSAPDARPTWDSRLGCLGGWSGPLFCAVGQECTSFPNMCTPAPAPGMLATGDICTGRAQCASGICATATGFPSRYCFAACERNADCASGSTCVLPFGAGSREANVRRCTPVAGSCARCTNATDYCDEEAFSPDGLGACLAACRTTSDCSMGDCRIRNGSSLTPYCERSAHDCASDEIRVDTDSGRRQACVKLRPCFDMSECAPGLSCVEVAYGGLTAPVRFCGRVL